MEDEGPKEGIDIFGLFIQKILLPDGRIDYILFGRNQGIPKEAIIMQLKALLNNEKERYFSKFDDNFSGFEE